MSSDTLRRARTIYHQRRRAAIAAGTWGERFHSPVAAREHIAYLREEGKLSTQSIATLADLGLSSINPIIYPEKGNYRTQITLATHEAILSVRVTHRGLPDRALITSIGSRRRVQALNRIGWSTSEVARRLNVSVQCVSQALRSEHLSVGMARRIAAVYDQLSMTPGNCTRARRAAERGGWPPPLAWDDDTIDDPRARPWCADSAEDEASGEAYDEVAVERALANRSVKGLNQVDRLECARRAYAQGHRTGSAIASRLGTGTITGHNLLAAITPTPTDAEKEAS